MTAGVADLEQLYRDLHANPELSRQEHRTAALAGDQLAAAGFDVTTNIDGTGVAGVLANGAGPTAPVSADVDALPVREDTALPYASFDGGADPGHFAGVESRAGVATLTTAVRTWFPPGQSHP
jgi:metal-dependent amidase/aminoacylase/carboxypeptidase family protein